MEVPVSRILLLLALLFTAPLWAATLPGVPASTADQSSSSEPDLAQKKAAYGALAAWLPAVLFARMVARRMRRQANAGSALMALMVGEGIKIALTVALLLAAPKVLTQVHWLALLAGFVVTIKAAWLALWLMSARRRSAKLQE